MRHSVRARFLQTLACAGCALALPAPALAAGGSPVHVDPASPVAKEYALPLATARGAAPESGKNGKLFGSGIHHGTPKTTVTTPRETPPPVTSPSEPPATTTTTTTTVITATATTPVTVRKPHRHRHRHRHHRRRLRVATVTQPTLTRTTTARQLGGHATPAAYRVLRPGSASGLLWMALAAVVVIALGSAGGWALRRRR